MSEILSNPDLRVFLTSLVSGELNLVTGLTWLIIATLLSMIGGAIGGMILAGKEIGYQFSAIVGSLFAPAGVIPGIFLGWILLRLVNN